MKLHDAIKVVRRFCSARSGVAAIEFAMLAPIFFGLMFMTAEFCIFFYKSSHLKYVLYEASREIQTGEIQKAVSPSESFKVKYCTNANFMFDCDEIFFDVRKFDSLADIAFPDAQFDKDGHATNFVFKPGGSEEITAMRVATPFFFVTPMVQKYMQPNGDPVILVGYAVVKNEPY